MRWPRKHSPVFPTSVDLYQIAIRISVQTAHIPAVGVISGHRWMSICGWSGVRFWVSCVI